MKKYYRSFFIGLLLIFAGAVMPVNGVMADSIEKLSIQGENFVNERGEPVRFWGFNVVSLYPTHKQAEAIAGQLASYGVNVVRPHHTTRDASGNWNATWAGGSGVGALIKYDYSNNTTRTPNTEAYDRFDYFNAKLREKGIYTRLSLDGTRSYLPGDVDILITDDADRQAWYDAMEVLNKLYWEQSRDLRRMLPTIDERAALLNEEFIEEFLTHENPYTGLTYAEDPQTLTLEVANETSAEYTIVAGNRFVRPDGNLTYSDGTKLSSEDAAKLQYWEDKLMNKWDVYLISIGQEYFDFYDGLTDDAKRQIRSDFLRKLDEDYFLRIKKLVREQIGCDTPITYSTFWRGENNLKMHVDNGDYIEEHSYSDPLVPGSIDDLFETATRQTRVTDMPYFVGELNQKESLVNVPSRTTLLFSSAVYGSFYNWTGINFFAWNHGDQYIDENGNAKNPFRTPDLSNADSRSFLIGELEKDSMMLDHMRTAGILYKNGYIRESTQKKIDYVDEPYWASAYATLMAPKYAFNSGWQSIHSIYKEFAPENKSIPLTQAVSPRFLQEVQSPVVSDTNEIVKDVDKKQLRVQAPQAEGFSGFTNDSETISTKHLKAAGQEGSATVLLVSADGEALSDSKHMVISNTAVAHEHNAALNNITGMEYHLEVSVQNLKAPGAGEQWQFEVTRPAEAAGAYLILADSEGAMKLPAVAWNEGELRLVSDAGQSIAYTLRSADGESIDALPAQGGGVTVSVAFGAGMEKPAQLIAALYRIKDGQQLAYQYQTTEGSLANTGEIVVPEAQAEEIAQVSQTQYTDTEAEEGVMYEYTVQGYAQGQPVGDPQTIEKRLNAQDSEKPAPVKDLAVSELRARSVTLTWAYPNGGNIDGYRVYRDGVQIGDTKSQTYTDASAQPQTVYVYEVKAVRGAAESMGASARVSTPEDTDLIFQFYKDGAYGAGTVYNRLDDTGQFVTDTISAGQATGLVPEGTKVLRYKMTANTGTKTPDKMPYVNIIWGNSLQQSVSYSLENIIDTAALKLYINLMQPRQKTEIGLLNKNEDGSVSSIRLSLADYIETEDTDFVTAKEPLVWQEVIIPLSDFVEKGVYYRKNNIDPETENAFNWARVIGFTFAQSNEGSSINSCRLHDIKLVSFDQRQNVQDMQISAFSHQAEGIALQWTPVDGADSYRIFRRGGEYGLKLFLWEKDNMKPLIQPIKIR